MKLVQQSATIVESLGSLKDIERAARICYKSEDKITFSSAEKLVKSLIERGHHAMLEFGRDIYVIVRDSTHETSFFNWLLWNNQLTGIDTSGSTEIDMMNESPIIFRLNPRKLLELFTIDIKEELSPFIYEFCRLIQETSPYLIQKPYEFADYNDQEDYYNQYRLYLSPPRSTVNFLALQTETVHIVTNRGVSHELVRHRSCSFAQESTRYVDYTGAMEFIVPVWSSDSMDTPTNEFWHHCNYTEKKYLTLREAGWKKQEAREVLSNALKTELMMKATLREWQHIFKLRCAKDAHPQMQALMIPLRKQFEEKYPHYNWR